MWLFKKSRPKEEEAMRVGVEAKMKAMCFKAAKEGQRCHSEFLSYIHDLRKEITPGRIDQIEAIVDAIKKFIKDTDTDSVPKFYAMLVTV